MNVTYEAMDSPEVQKSSLYDLRDTVQEAIRGLIDGSIRPNSCVVKGYVDDLCAQGDDLCHKITERPAEVGPQEVGRVDELLKIVNTYC